MPWRFGPSEQPLKYVLEEDKALYRDAEDLGLKATGLKVLALFVGNAHHKFNSNAIAEWVNGANWYGNRTRFAAEYVRQIRKVLEPSEGKDAIRNERSIGYCFTWNVSTGPAQAGGNSTTPVSSDPPERKEAREPAKVPRTTGSDPANQRFPLFRDPQIRNWQEISSAERPQPVPDNAGGPMPPFPPKAKIHYVAGCHFRLQADARYELESRVRRGRAWPEIEVVLYQGDPLGPDWKRMASIGAKTSVQGRSRIRAEAENWLLTCWGKHRIAWDEPWWPFVPVNCRLDRTGKVLLVSFDPPDKAAIRVTPGPPEDQPIVVTILKARK